MKRLILTSGLLVFFAVAARGMLVAPSVSQAPVKSTYLVVYRPGPSWLKGKPLSEQPLKEHGRYILSLHIQGALKSAGPFGDNTGGAAVFEAKGEAEAQAVVAADPAVVSGVFLAELHPWTLVDWQQRAKK